MFTTSICAHKHARATHARARTRMYTNSCTQVTMRVCARKCTASVHRKLPPRTPRALACDRRSIAGLAERDHASSSSLGATSTREGVRWYERAITALRCSLQCRRLQRRSVQRRSVQRRRVQSHCVQRGRISAALYIPR